MISLLPHPTAETSSQQGRLPHHRILIVDDNESIHGDFQKILCPDAAEEAFDAEEAEFFGHAARETSSADFELSFASQGMQAMEMVRSEWQAGRRFSLVFMDLRMPPGLDGLETACQLCEVDPDVQVVLCTAYSDYSWEQMSSQVRGSERLLILKKPFDPIEVIQLAHSLTAKWSLLQESRRHAESLELAVRLRTHELETEVARRNVLLEELSEARDMALESVRMKGRFLANMSHEIRTPMNGVIGMSELLVHTNLNREQREYVDTIRSSADLLLGIINDILDSSKIDSGTMMFDAEDFDLREIVESTLDVVASAAGLKGLELAGCLQHDVCPTLRGDGGRLKQVLTNMVGNAVKFTDAGEVTLIVSCLTESPFACRLRFAVRDTGIGIEPSSVRRIFEAFHQADGSNTRRYGGTGLGLSICKQIVEAMGGEIGAESELGKGSVFWFTLGFEKRMISPRPVIQAPADLRVLVVDDNATNRTILQLQLANLQIRSEAVPGGPEALEILRREVSAGDPFPLAIVDMQMPGMDGMALAKAIKADTTISSTRLVILSSLGDHIAAEELRGAGVEEYIVKPVKQTRLLISISAMFGNQPLPSFMSPRPAASPVPVSSIRILLAEDNVVNQKVALMQLRRLGYNADLASDGNEVLAALENTTYDIILMDCQMPVMDGYTATREIRAKHRNSIRIIAMTAHAMAGDREKCLAAGMDDHLTKPVHPEDLQRILARWEPQLLSVTSS